MPTVYPELNVPIFIPNKGGGIVITTFLEEETKVRRLGDLPKFTKNARNRPDI